MTALEIIEQWLGDGGGRSESMILDDIYEGGTSKFEEGVYFIRLEVADEWMRNIREALEEQAALAIKKEWL